MRSHQAALSSRKLQSIRGAIFAAVATLGILLSDAEASIQEFGPWKIGMSTGEAASFKQYAPYNQYRSSSTGSQFLATDHEFDYLDETVNISFRIGGDRIDTIYIKFETTRRAEDAVALARKAANHLHSEIGLPSADDFFDNFDLVSHLEDEVRAPSGRWFHDIPNFAYLKVGIRKLDDSEFATQIYIMADRNAPPPAPATPDSPSSEDSPPPVLEEWTLQVPGGEGEFKRSLASVHALLVRPIGNGGGNAAQAMKLSATAVPGNGTGLEFGFNQPIGEDMSRASEQVVRAIQVKHGTLPGGMNVEFGFADKWGGKDGPSAAVATALLIESLLSGFEIPPALAVTGDLNADQTVQPVGGVADKIRGAMAKDCNWIGVPAANEEDLNDLVVEENLRRFLSAKIFTLKNLEDAVLLANPDGRSPDVSAALTALEAIQADLTKGGAAALYAPEMQSRLLAVLEAVPNCYSAKILLATSRKQTPVRYSLAGTLVRIDEAMAPYAEMIESLKEGESVERFRFGRDNPMSEARNRLNDLKRKSDCAVRVLT